MEKDLNDMHTHVEVKEYVDNIPVKRKSFCKADYYTDKILTFIYSELIKFGSVGKNKGKPMSKIFIDNIKGIINSKICIHHSHISNEDEGYAHSFCNARVRENRSKTTVVPHNLFRFDFFSC